MGTYRSWLAAQEARSDGVGMAARWWSQVSPGKLSAPAGILRKLEEYRDEPGISDELKTKHEHAIEGMKLAIAEWREAGGSAAPLTATQSTQPVIPGMPGSQDKPDEPDGPNLGDRLATVAEVSALPQVSDPVLRAYLKNISDQLTVIIRQNTELLNRMNGHAEPDEPDDDESVTPGGMATLYAMADFSSTG